MDLQRLTELSEFKQRETIKALEADISGLSSETQKTYFRGFLKGIGLYQLSVRGDLSEEQERYLNSSISHAIFDLVDQPILIDYLLQKLHELKMPEGERIKSEYDEQRGFRDESKAFLRSELDKTQDYEGQCFPESLGS